MELFVMRIISLNIITTDKYFLVKQFQIFTWYY